MQGALAPQGNPAVAAYAQRSQVMSQTIGLCIEFAIGQAVLLEANGFPLLKTGYLLLEDLWQGPIWQRPAWTTQDLRHLLLAARIQQRPGTDGAIRHGNRLLQHRVQHLRQTLDL